MADIDRFTVKGNWLEVLNAARTTVKKTALSDRVVSFAWRKNMLLAEHSPIRLISFHWRWTKLPYWVSVHLTRHWLGILHWVQSSRTDRTGIERDDLPQNIPVLHECEANAQALINISRKRLCSQAATETRDAWKAVIKEIEELDPVLASILVPECIYRGFCPEFNCCGYIESDAYKKKLQEYRSLDTN